MSTTLVRNVRRIDPIEHLDDIVDVCIVDGLVDRVGPAGSSISWDVVIGATIIDGTDCILSPGLVDLHCHVFGAAGVADPDSIGVKAAVPVIVDAGGAGAATIDDFIATKTATANTRILNFMAVEAGGITEPAPAHNTRRSIPEMQTASLDDFLAAFQRHERRIVGLKVWGTATGGVPWIGHATTLSELIDRPLMVHIGEVEPSPLPNITGDVLDHLQGGDIVTHCFTGLDGAIIDATGDVSPEASAGRERGVLFDAAPGDVNLSFDRALGAMERGFLPDVISSDLHRYSVPGTVSLLHVMGAFLALGMSLRATIERASLRPAEVAQTSVGRPLAGQPATLSMFRATPARTIYADGDGGRIVGDELLEPVGCFIDGTWFEADASAAAASQNLCANNRQLVQSFAPGQLRFLHSLHAELTSLTARDNRWRGLELHQLVHRERVRSGISIADGLDALYGGIVGGHIGPPAGWMLAEIGRDETLSRLSSIVA